MKTGRIRHCPRTGQRKGFDANELHLATWNVRTLLQAGKMQEVAREMLKYKLDLIAIQEIRWQGQGKIDKKDFSIIYSGPNNKTGQLGTGFLINKTIRSSILEYKTVNDRICKIRLKGKFRNITIITVHAPTEDKPEEDKDRFYEELDDTLAQVQRYDMVLVMGDFNAQIGSKESQRDVAGPFTLHEYNNDNGDLLAEFASRNKLYIRSTTFQHRKIHLGTWKLPGRNETNQIDHVLISKRYYSSVTDVRTCRGPNCDSDHYLVQTKIREKLSTLHTLKRNKQIKWDTDNLKDDDVTRNKYQDTIREKLEGRQFNTVDDKWEGTKKAIIEAAKETINEREYARNVSWFDEECKDSICEKNLARQKMLARDTRSNREVYNELRRKSKKILKKKKRESLKKDIKKIEEMNKEGEVRKFYAAVNKMKKKEFKPTTSGCRNETGAIILDETVTLKIWADHFQKLLNKQHPEDNVTHAHPHNTTTTEEEGDEIPSIDEVRKALERMKNNRAPGEDGIVAELLKYGGEPVIIALTDIIEEVWTTERMPTSWSNGIICPIHKKGDIGRCGNYRGITLLDTAYKALTTIINNRIKEKSNAKIGEYQCGFREARGTTDQLFVVRQITEKCLEYDIDLYILFIDFKQAFDSVRRCTLIEAMKDLEISPKLINLTIMTMENSKAQVKINNNLSEPFEITTGVKQGDGLSTTLFIIALHKAIKDIDQRGTIFYKSSQICAYADDVGIIARTKDKLIEVFKQVQENGKELGLIINESKTQYMKTSASEDRRTAEDIQMENVTYKAVTQFKYLGELINNEGRPSAAIKERIQIGNRAYFANISLLKNKLISRKTKMKIYKTLIRPIVTYGSENWTLTQEDQEKIRRFERKIIRRIYGAVRLNEEEWRIRTNREILEILEGEDIVKFIKSQRLRWFGHVQRMEENRMPKKILAAKVYATRRKGRPRLRWMDQVLSDLRVMRVTGWGTAVKDRLVWRRVVEEAKAHPGL
uniref:Craniofacial development protein 2 n=1 Tax=Cacopsylla melanoneura TaxID=428564 RepID=A0A8D9B1A7_9HEMI